MWSISELPILVHLSIHLICMQILHYRDYCYFIVLKSDSYKSRNLFYSQNYFDYSIFLAFPYKFYQLANFYKKSLLRF